MGSVDLSGLNRTLGEIIARSQNLAPALREGALLLTGEFQKNFEEGGRPEKWIPSKRSVKEGGQTLRDTGALEHSLLTPQVDERSISFGSNLPYASIHLFGGEIHRPARSEIFTRNRKKRGPGRGRFSGGTKSGRGNTLSEYTIKMPQRYYLYFSNQAEITLGDILRNHVMGN